MKEVFSSKLWAQVREKGVIAVLVVDHVKDAAPLAQALLEGGVGAMELTLRTPAAVEALRVIRREVPEMLAGIGTILTPEQVTEVVDAGASFGVSPGCNPRVIEAAIKAGLSFAPGVATPTDIEIAVETGCRLLKFFPAEPTGGLAYLKSAAAPYLHLGLEFVPLGGVNPQNARDYLSDKLIAAVGGSWIAKRDLIQAGDWETIKSNAAGAAAVAQEARNG